MVRNRVKLFERDRVCLARLWGGMLIDRRAVVTYWMACDFVSAIIGQKKTTFCCCDRKWFSVLPTET